MFWRATAPAPALPGRVGPIFMGKKRTHVSVAAYWVPSASPAVKPRGVSKKFAAKSAAAAQRKLDPKQRARQAAKNKGGKGGKKGKGGQKNKR